MNIQINPHKKIKEIESKDRKVIYRYTQKVLEKAIKRLIRNKDKPEFPNSWLLSH